MTLAIIPQFHFEDDIIYANKLGGNCFEKVVQKALFK